VIKHTYILAHRVKDGDDVCFGPARKGGLENYQNNLLLQSAASVTHPDKTKYFPKAFFRVL
jgi:hypothetical protein